MTPTPGGFGPSATSASPWVLAFVLAVCAALLVAGAAARTRGAHVGRLRKAGGRAALSLDAAFAPGDRQQALEYLLEDQHRIVMEEPRGDDDRDPLSHLVVFGSPGECHGDDSGAD